ncbi:MAG: hypothetical protein V1734_03625 [Nanoarchaeota archaeon]
MVIVHKQGLYGNKPFLFRNEPSRMLYKEVWTQDYKLVTPDSFEVGSAYSLHLTQKGALKFKSPYNWYQKTGGKPKVVYVSPATLEAMVREKKHAIFEIDD